MAFYDYRCQCGHTQEESHPMMEDPIIKCTECGAEMKKIITGGSGYIMKTGSTRQRTMGNRYGHKKTSNQPTPTESAQAKAKAAAATSAENKKNAYDPSNPYKQFT